MTRSAARAVGVDDAHPSASDRRRHVAARRGSSRRPRRNRFDESRFAPSGASDSRSPSSSQTFRSTSRSSILAAVPARPRSPQPTCAARFAQVVIQPRHTSTPAVPASPPARPSARPAPARRPIRSDACCDTAASDAPRSGSFSGWKPCATSYRCRPRDPLVADALADVLREIAGRTRASSSAPDPTGRSPISLMCAIPRPQTSAISRCLT